MENDYDGNWNRYDVQRYNSSSRDSDENLLLSHRIYKKRHCPDQEADDRRRRSTISLIMKFFLFCATVIMFCLLLYIPVYNKAGIHNYKVNLQSRLEATILRGARGERGSQAASTALPPPTIATWESLFVKNMTSLAGWSQHTNRDTKLYVLPNNVTLIHEPTNICTKVDRSTKNKLLLLIVVCSATDNFERRAAIRNTWGSPKKFKQLNKNLKIIREKYKHYNFTYDLYNFNNSRVKWKTLGISRSLLEITKERQNKTDSVAKNKSFDNEVKHYDDITSDDDVESDETSIDESNIDEANAVDDKLKEFDMIKEFSKITSNTNHDYESNIIQISSMTYNYSAGLENVLNLQNNDTEIHKISDDLDDNKGYDDKVEFKLVFLLGLSVRNNNSVVQDGIDVETKMYGDVIQEDFIDSYNNLTLKSIMMLKWVNNKCNESVRYFLKTDDDMYVNIPNLIANLKYRSHKHDTKRTDKEYLLIGDLISGATPVSDVSSKWYSPPYMYWGRIYPNYLSGTGYLFSAPAAKSLYDAALRTRYFHLEDIYITGICARRASPQLSPEDDPSFSYVSVARVFAVCSAHTQATLHRVSSRDMEGILEALADLNIIDTCERMHLTQLKRELRIDFELK